MQAKGARIYLIIKVSPLSPDWFSTTHHKVKEAGVIFQPFGRGRWLCVLEEGATPTFFFLSSFFFFFINKTRNDRQDWLLAGSRRRLLYRSSFTLSQPGTCLMFVSGMQAMDPLLLFSQSRLHSSFSFCSSLVQIIGTYMY